MKTFYLSIFSIFLFQVQSSSISLYQKTEDLRALSNLYLSIYEAVEVTSCNQTTNCKYGKCDGNTCICNKDRANYPPLKILLEDTLLACEYERKNQLTAFLLNFILGLGIGHLYAGRIVNGVCQLIVGIIQCCCCSLFKKMNDDGEEEKINSRKLCICSFQCFYFIWLMFDAFMFGFNVYRDGNGVPLKNW